MHAQSSNPTPRGSLSGPDLAIVIGGALLLLGSFLPFYEIDFLGEALDWTAWSNAWSFLPLLPLAVLLGAGSVVAVALERMGRATLPARVLGRPTEQVQLVGAALVAVTMVVFVLRVPESASVAIGGWLCAAGSIAIVVGLALGRRSDASTPAAAHGAGRVAVGARTPEALAMVGGGVVVLLGSFLTVYEAGIDSPESMNAWAAEFRVLLLPVLLVLIAVVPVVLAVAGVRGEPTGLAGVPWTTVRTAAAGWGALAMVCYLVGEPFVSVDGLDIELARQLGFWLMLLGSLVAAGGAIHQERSPGPVVGI